MSIVRTAEHHHGCHQPRSGIEDIFDRRQGRAIQLLVDRAVNHLDERAIAVTPGPDDVVPRPRCQALRYSSSPRSDNTSSRLLKFFFSGM